jgi:hypothetical protein
LQQFYIQLLGNSGDMNSAELLLLTVAAEANPPQMPVGDF